MASLTLDKSFFTDDRVEYLSRHCREDKLMTEARLARLYLLCVEQKNELATAEIVNFATQWTGEDFFIDLMVEAKLAEETNDIGCYRIKGVAERLKLSKKRATAGKKGGDTTAKIKNLLEMTEPKSIYEKIIWLWNNKVAEKIGKPKISTLNDERKRLMDRGTRVFTDPDDWKSIMDQVCSTDWILEGRITFTFETIFRNNNYVKFKEAYDNRAGGKTGSGGSTVLDSLYETDFSKEHMDFIEGDSSDKSQ